MTDRRLTSSERKLLADREAEFDEFLEDRMPVLAEFMEALGLPDPPMVLVEAERYLPPLDLWLKDQDIKADDETWLLTRIGYFIGEYLVQRLGGCWFLNDVPDSKYFARYVVGEFAETPNRNAMVDPFDIASVFIAEPRGRSLSQLVNSVETEIAQA